LYNNTVKNCTIVQNKKNPTSDGTMTTVYIIDISSSRGSTDFTVSYHTRKRSSCLCVEV